MADERNYPWLKLDKNILDDKKIKYIRKQPDGDALFVMWVGLLCLGMKCCDGGYIYVTQNVPYDAVALSDELKIEPRVIQLGIALFAKLEMIEIYDDGSILIKNWGKHQSVDKYEKRLESDRVRQQRKREHDKQLSLDTDIDKEKDKDIDIESERDSHVTSFDKFWKVYPKKLSKQQALKAWLKIKPDNVMTEKIILSVKEHKKLKDWQKENGQYIPYASTFLNQRRWEDEIGNAESDPFERLRERNPRK